MPPRWITVAIVVFWAATAAWLFVAEIRPQLQTGEPPAFFVDRVDESPTPRPLSLWKVTKNGQYFYDFSPTVAAHPETDTFELIGGLNKKRLNDDEQKEEEKPRQNNPDRFPEFRSVNMVSKYRVNRGGNLVGLETTTSFELWTSKSDRRPEERVQMIVRGATQDRLLTLETEITRRKSRGQFAKPRTKTLDPEPVSSRGVVLNALHPLHRMPDLQPGQTWSMPVLDPFALVSLAGGAAWEHVSGSRSPIQHLRAEVLPESRDVHWRDRSTPCHVIEYRGDEAHSLSIRTFARKKDGLVVRQEVRLWGDVWVFTRTTEW
jgi:hypothetical protein